MYVRVCVWSFKVLIFLILYTTVYTWFFKLCRHSQFYPLLPFRNYTYFVYLVLGTFLIFLIFKI